MIVVIIVTIMNIKIIMRLLPATDDGKKCQWQNDARDALTTPRRKHQQVGVHTRQQRSVRWDQQFIHTNCGASQIAAIIAHHIRREIDPIICDWTYSSLHSFRELDGWNGKPFGHSWGTSTFTATNAMLATSITAWPENVGSFDFVVAFIVSFMCM